MKSLRIATIVLVVALFLPGRILAGGLGGMQPNMATDSLAYIFGTNAAFTAVAHCSIIRGEVPMEMEMKFAFLDGNVRTEMDMSKMAVMPPEVAAQMKQMGMDCIVTVFHPSENTGYLIYPGMKAYCAIGKSDKAGKNDVKPPKIDRVELNKEIIDGHPCVKNKLTMTFEDEHTVEMFVWQAKDLQQFPIKAEMTTEHGVITTVFHDIKMKAPDAALFKIPAGYRKYSSVKELMMSSMLGIIGAH